MVRNLRIGLLALFAASLVVLTAEQGIHAADKEDLKKAMDAIDQLIKSDGKGAEAAAKASGIDIMMHLFKPKNKGGIGVGPKGDGIEVKIINLAKKALPAAQLTKEAEELITMAKQTKAIGDVNEFYGPKEKRAGKDPKEWKKYNDEMKQFSLELIAAVKGGKPDDVKKVANSINSSCVNCHTVFRD